MAGTDLQEPHAEVMTEPTYELAAGPDLDALIADKVMGWSRREDYYYTGPPGPAAFTHVAQCTIQDFRPSSDMAWAWKVVEKLAERNIVLNMYASKVGAHVQFSRQGKVLACRWFPQTALAICQNALHAVAQEKLRD